jgi:class 3 adenylate cyclase
MAKVCCMSMSPEQQQLEVAIAALEGQRATLGDAVVESLLAPARARLSALSAPPAPAAPAQSLRQVTILFLDAVGSTTLAQHLDPEAIGAAMDDALSRGTAIVQAQRGKVLQYAGDNILAAFGADEAREDDAERAVRCGLALLELGKTLGAEVLAAHGHAGFDVRVGLHTGGVLLGGGVDADGSIRGIAVNIAARMEQTAPAGALRISHDTYLQVRGLFEVDAQDPLMVKGVDHPINSYLVRRAKPRNFRIASRGIEGVTTRMIGREAELGALQAAFERLFHERRLAAVTVVADAGIGKSRLLNEFQGWSEARPERFFLFRGRATPQTGTQAFGLLRDILAWRFQIADDDTIAVARAKMEQGIVPLFEHDDGPDLAESHAHLLGHLIGIEWRDSRHIRAILDDPQQLRNRAFHAAAQYFRRLGATDGSPVIVQLEDLHWADDESLDFLNYLAEVNRDVPLLVLAFTRPPLFERRSDWLVDRGRTEGFQHHIELPPLDETGSRMLADELLQKLPEPPRGLERTAQQQRRGQPLLHGRAIEDADRPGRHRNRCSLEGQRRAAAADPGADHADRRAAGAARRSARAREARAAAGQRHRVGLLGPGAGGHRRPGCRPTARAGAARADAAAPRCRARRPARIRLPPPFAAPGDLRHRAQAQQAGGARQGGAVAGRDGGVGRPARG